ncbi:MAG: hypothetical protein SCALA702_25560 [Melioribacteraceae bacterium]|nr:MAG: hypothetical protein SCALA702_25560 [Melioribacteraceae bacterium]
MENPSFSPEGNQVYYLENLGFNQDALRRIDTDGRNNEIVFTREDLRNYVLTDDNATIIFDNSYNYPDSADTEILITNYFGDGFTKVLAKSDSTAFLDIFPVDMNPVDSLLLLDILFEENGTITNRVFTYDLVAGRYKQISGNLNAYASSFSPDKSKILYAAEEGNNSFTINTADTSGNNVLIIYRVEEKIELAGYSLDGFKVLFGAPDSMAQIQVSSIASDGTNFRWLTYNGVNNKPSGYSNDSKFVLYSSNRYVENPEDYDVYIYDEVLDNEHLIMNNSGSDYGVEFSPKEQKVLILSDSPGLPNLFIYDFTHIYH